MDDNDVVSYVELNDSDCSAQKLADKLTNQSCVLLDADGIFFAFYFFQLEQRLA